MKQAIPRARNCFCCGIDNPVGLHLTYYAEDNKIFTEFILDKNYGYSEYVIHSGIALGIVVEAMGWVPAHILQNPEALSASLNVKFLKPLPVDRKLNVIAEAISINHWVSEVQGIITDEKGDTCMKAVSKFTMRSLSNTSLSGHFI